MTDNRRSLAAGLLLILIGAAFLFAQLAPQYFEWFDIENAWPLIIVAFGGLMLLIGILTGTPALAVPACIIGGIGGLLYWQNATGNWETWAYAWTLIPGFVGIGIILSGLLSGQVNQGLREGGRTLIVSAVMFAIFGSFLGGGDVFKWMFPIVAILGGVVLLVQNVLKRS
jgi:hypothetical protein